MRIKWENIICLLFVIALIMILCRLPLILYTLSTIAAAVCEGELDPAVGIAALGVVCITILGIIIVLSRR